MISGLAISVSNDVMINDVVCDDRQGRYSPRVHIDSVYPPWLRIDSIMENIVPCTRDSKDRILGC